jgi:hypothetical protein
VNGGYYYMGSMPPMYMIRADITLPLRLGRRRAEVAERSSELAQARHAYEATAQSLHYRIREEYAMAEAAEKLIHLYRDTVIPQARFTIQSSLASYETGATDFLAVLMNHMAVIEYEMSYHEQMQDMHLALGPPRRNDGRGVDAMKRSAVVLLTLLMLGAGFGAGLWYAKRSGGGAPAGEGRPEDPLLRRSDASGVQVGQARHRAGLRHETGTCVRRRRPGGRGGCGADGQGALLSRPAGSRLPFRQSRAESRDGERPGAGVRSKRTSSTSARRSSS